MAGERPSGAVVLSLIGGVFILLVGLGVAVVGAVLTFFIGGIGGIFGLVGAVWGVLIIVMAVLLSMNPRNHVAYGALIVVFAVLSWFGSFGGLFIGFLLALVGGILAIVWQPAARTPA